MKFALDPIKNERNNAFILITEHLGAWWKAHEQSEVQVEFPAPRSAGAEATLCSYWLIQSKR